MKTTNLTIYSSDQQVNKLRKINILLDGKYCCAIANGKNHSIALSPGAHTLEAKIDWCGSAPVSFEIKDSQQINMALNCNYQPAKSLLGKLHAIIFFGGLVLNLYFKSAVLLWSVLAFSFTYQVIEAYKHSGKGILYYLTIGRKKYLKLEALPASDLQNAALASN